LKYIVNIVFIALFFIGCNTKETVVYNPQPAIKIEKENLDNYNLKQEEEKEIIEEEEVIVQEANITISTDVAIVYSSKRIGKYAIKVSDIALAYSVNTDNNFSYNFYDIEDESNESINNVLNEIKDNNISNVMFYLTSPILTNLYNYKDIDKFDIYLPLINKNVSYYDSNETVVIPDINSTIDNNISIDKNITNILLENNDSNISEENNNSSIAKDRFARVVFGGIDYESQLKALKETASSHVIEIYDNKYRNLKLHSFLEYDDNVTSYLIEGKYPNYKRFIERHRLLKDSSIILNLSVVKSSIFLSQLRANDDLNITEVLTTQNNYTPLLFVLTQKEDTTKLIVANSINNVDTKLYNINKIIGNNIKYDWVNYSTILGLEYFKTKNKLLFENIEIIDNQINYPVNLFKTKNNSFTSYVKEQNDTIIE